MDSDVSGYVDQVEELNQEAKDYDSDIDFDLQDIKSK
jgi:hypothetical protein